MKRTTLLIGCIAIGLSSAYAQKKGFMNKVNAAFEEAAAANDPNKPNAKEVKKDIESTTLDSKPINKDSRNLSGIYYAKTPIRIGQNGSGKYNFAKKFLVNYEEGEKQEIEFISRYYFENRKDIPPLVYAPAPGTPDYFPVTTSKKMGHLHLDGISDKKYGGSASANYAAPCTYLSFSDPNGNYRTEVSMSFNFSDLLEFEEGIIFIGRMDYIIKANTPEKYKVLIEHGGYNLFYKKEKEEKALAMTDEEVWEKAKAFYTKYYAAFKAAEGSNVELAKPIAKFKEEPSNADLFNACNKRMTEMPHYNEKLIYVYPTTGWENRFENVGLLGRTLTHRIMQVQAIMKEGDVCKITQFLIRQDNTYKGGSNAENFTGNGVQAIGDIDKTVISCTNAMKYKK